MTNLSTDSNSLQKNRKNVGRIARIASIGALCLAAALLCAGCGSSSSTSSNANAASSSATGSATGHIVSFANGTLVIEDAKGINEEFSIDSSGTGLNPGTLTAYSAGGVMVKVDYTGSGSSRTAKSLSQAPNPLDKYKHVDGYLTVANTNTITMTPTAGGAPVSFGVKAADIPALDISHLHNEHIPAHKLTRIYYQTVSGTKYAKGFADIAG